MGQDDAWMKSFTTVNVFSIAILSFVALGAGPSSAATIAQIRDDFDAHTPVDTESSIGKIADTHGTGSWDFYGSATLGGALTPSTYQINGIASATTNAYAVEGQTQGMPGITSETFWGPAPPADGLALHPGHHTQAIQFLVVRWTAGIGSVGTFNIAGALTNEPGNSDGVTLDIWLNGFSEFNTTALADSTEAYDLDLTIAAGDTVDFIIGNNTTWNNDRSSVSATITGTPVPEPTGAMLLFTGLLVVGFGRRRK